MRPYLGWELGAGWGAGGVGAGLARNPLIKPNVGHNNDPHAWLIARNSAFLISALLAHSTSFPFPQFCLSINAGYGR